MKASHFLAVALAIGATAWILSGQLGNQAPATANVAKARSGEDAKAAPSEVRVAQSTAKPYTVSLTVTGRTAASRQVAVRVQTSGRIEKIAARKGQVLAAGDLIAAIAEDDRPQRLAEAKALVDQRRIAYDASSQLAEQGWRAKTSDAEAKAALDAALAELAAIRLDIARTAIRAPFGGVLNQLDIELGDVVDGNMVIGTLYDLDPMIVVADVSEREIGRLAVGDKGSARLISGQTVEGRLRYIGRVADPATRTFRVELEVANPDQSLPAGITADVTLPLDTIQAHFIAPSALTLADDGSLGVKIVGDDNTVRFVPVSVVADTADGVWITGLPDRVTLITVGQDYVVDGETVTPVKLSGSSFSTSS